MTNTPHTITDPSRIELLHMKTQLRALHLELQGMRHSRGSVYAHIKRTYNFRGSKQRVYDQFRAYINQRTKEVL